MDCHERLCACGAPVTVDTVFHRIDATSMGTIATERLIMRPPTRDDFEDCATLWADPEVVRYIGGRPFTREESWARLTRYVGHWALQGYGFWALRERDTGRYAGEVGLADFKRNITPSLSGAQEMGWVLGTWAQGRGYATEAVRAALAWNEDRFAGARLVCMIDPGNAPSLRVAEKSGFREYARTTYKDSNLILLERQGRGAPSISNQPNRDEAHQNEHRRKAHQSEADSEEERKYQQRDKKGKDKRHCDTGHDD